MNRKRLALTGTGVVAVLAIVAGVVWWRTDDPDPHRDPARPGVDVADPAVVAADAFAAAWQRGSLATAPVTRASGDVAAVVAVVTAGLTPAERDRPMVAVTGVERTGAPSSTSAAGGASTSTSTSISTPTAGGAAAAEAVATARVTWKLDGGRTWTYPTSIPLVREGNRWRVAFTTAVVEPSLRPGEVLRSVRVPGTRGRVVDAAGASFVGEKGAVTVGIRKSRTSDPDGTARTVAGLTAVDAEALVAKVAAAGPDDFVEVATLARADYEKIRARIQPLPGTVFREDEPVTDLPAGFARALLGTTGTATPEIVAASKGRVGAGDLTGLTGLQRAQDAVLAGTPGLRVEAVASAAAPRELTSFPAEPGVDVALTIDRRVQVAADAAVAGTAKPSALVAIRVSTGDVLAVANGPSAASAYNRAFIGRYPPGSTFKVATALGLLQQGLTPDTVVNCPATVVMGKVFKNAEGEVLGPVPFRSDFAHSCNTAFVGQAEALSSADLTAAAARLGYRELSLGVPTFGGSVPITDNLTEHAANMIGQGKVEGSPLAVALASASVASGRSLQPRLIIDPAAPQPTPGEALPAQPIAYLQELMRAVVVDGTGGAVAGIPGGDVHGKTGTAEYGNESPPRTHAWFTGYQGDIAFAVLVEDGGFGGAVAAPVAVRFLSDLAGG